MKSISFLLLISLVNHTFFTYTRFFYLFNVVLFTVLPLLPVVCIGGKMQVTNHWPQYGKYTCVPSSVVVLFYALTSSATGYQRVLPLLGVRLVLNGNM